MGLITTSVSRFREMACFCSHGGAVIAHAAILSLLSIYSKLKVRLAKAPISPVEHAFCLHCLRARYLLIVTREYPFVHKKVQKFSFILKGLLLNFTYCSHMFNQVVQHIYSNTFCLGTPLSPY